MNRLHLCCVHLLARHPAHSLHSVGQLLATARGRNKKDASTAAAAQALVICQSRVAGMERQQTYAPAMMGGGAT